MILSHCTSVFRMTGKKMPCRNLFRKKDIFPNETSSLCERTNNLRLHSTAQDKQPKELILLEKPPEESTNFFKGENNATHLISENVARFGTIETEEKPSVEIFGQEYFTSDDSSLEHYANEDVKLPGPLDPCDEDISNVAPWTKPSFNFAAYANDSPLIQELAKLGVDLYQVEKRPGAMEYLLQRNFEDLQEHIRFLHDCGVTAQDLGPFITINPMVFKTEIDDMKTRIRYLRAHKFTADMIARVISKNPWWIMFSTKNIDNRLGYFQRQFKLNGDDVRYLATKQPKLITRSFHKINEMYFAFKEEMGFDRDQLKVILLDKPRLFMKNREKLVDVFDYVHNTMKLDHKLIFKAPVILTCRLERLKHRHKFLELIGKVQYDPKKPMYVSPKALVSGSDIEFCENVAKTTIRTYNIFLKTL